MCRFLFAVIAMLFLSACVHVADHASFDGWERHSQYVPMRDGTRIAVDYYRPTRNGVVHSEPLPVIMRMTPYGRHRLNEDGEIGDGPPNILFGGFEEFLESGFVVANVDMRGTGASFGTLDGWLSQTDAKDAHDLTEWLANQEWSSGNVGMTGISYLGGVQYLALGEASPHLKAIFPAMAQWDNYSTFNQNGVFRDLRNDEVWDGWQALRASIDLPSSTPTPGSIAPVDADANRDLLMAAAEEHRANRISPEVWIAQPFRDSINPVTGRSEHLERSAWHRLAQANSRGVAVYHWTGWYDHGAYAQTRAFKSLDAPQKLLIGPFYHRDRFADIAAIQVSWFEYWLKGIDNGIMDEPAVTYYLTGVSPEEGGWRTSDQWPLPNERREKFYFASGPTQTVGSINDGRLSFGEPPELAGRDDYPVNYEITLGGYVNQNNGIWRLQCSRVREVPEECYLNSGYPDLSERYDAKAITYTSDPLPKNKDVVGNPVVRFWTSSNRDDAIYYVVLEEVEPSGLSHFVSHYAIRGSHRQTNEAPYNVMGLPWHRSYSSDIVPMTGEPVEIALALNPVGNRFDKGNRIRVTIAGADSISTPLEVEDEGAVLSFYFGAEFPSSIDLPVIG